MLTHAIADGRGDLVFALRLLQGIATHWASAHQTHLRLQCVTNLPQLAAPLRQAYPDIGIYDIRALPIDFATDVIIEGPTPFGSAESIHTALGIQQAQGVPIIRIGEYGDPTLLTQITLQRIALLSHATPLALRDSKYIVGTGLAPEALGVMHDTELVAASSRHIPSTTESTLYQCYFRYGASCLRFVNLVAALEARKATHVHRAIEIMVPQRFDLNALQPSLLAAWGIGSVHWSAPGIERTLLGPSEGLPRSGRHLRLHDAYPISAQRMRQIILVSEPFWGCTGDQSWSEGISAQKIVSYEIRSHKRAFFTQYVESAPRRVQIYLRAHAQLVGSDDDVASVSRDRNAYEHVAGLLCDPQLHEDNQQFCQSIVRDHDLHGWFNMLLERVLTA